MSRESISVFMSKSFARFAKKARISVSDLWKTATLANQGAIDADLGGGVIKQRIARAGQGKSGGSRSIILFKKDARAVYIYGFEKKDRANLGPDELEAYRELAKVILGYSAAEMKQRVKDGALVELNRPSEEHNGKPISQQSNGRNS